MRQRLSFRDALYIKQRVLGLVEQALPMERISVDLVGEFEYGYYLEVFTKVGNTRTGSRTLFSSQAYRQHEATRSEEYLRVAAFEAVTLIIRERCFKAWHRN